MNRTCVRGVVVLVVERDGERRELNAEVEASLDAEGTPVCAVRPCGGQAAVVVLGDSLSALLGQLARAAGLAVEPLTPPLPSPATA